MAEKHTQIAIIDISSNEVRMYIAENSGGHVNFLETLKYPLNLAHDTFHMGMIGFDKVNTLCKIIGNFISVTKEYGVSYIKAVATTAIREAANRDYILDQIKIKTGLSVKIIDESTEKLYIFKMLSHIMSEKLKNTRTLMVHMGSNSVGLALCDGENTDLMQSIKIGSLRIAELFEDMHDNSPQFYLMIEEFVRTYTNDLKRLLPADIENLVISGKEAGTIAALCGANDFDMLQYTMVEDFRTLYNEVKYKSISAIASRYDVARIKTETLLPAMCLYGVLLEFSTADRVLSPKVNLGEVMVFEYFDSTGFGEVNKQFNKNILESAKKIANKYNIDSGHYLTVADYCSKIFDKMKKGQGLNRRDKLLLQIAATLHDCGKYVNADNHHQHSYNLIKGSGIAGLSYSEIDIIANIALYHSRNVPDTSDPNYKDLKSSDKVLVSKLAAILRVADALDRSRKQKITAIDVILTEKQLLINAKTSRNIDLEQWALKEKGVFFEEVFGIEPVLQVSEAV
ncbi:HD domain-containing protein [Tyzzerella sp. OttesenSCG-928-J15]|nr:HD domain-containing protein [Tyzzerella sp. OttesenSCG-928-J15]